MSRLVTETRTPNSSASTAEKSGKVDAFVFSKRRKRDGFTNSERLGVCPCASWCTCNFAPVAGSQTLRLAINDVGADPVTVGCHSICIRQQPVASECCTSYSNQWRNS